MPSRRSDASHAAHDALGREPGTAGIGDGEAQLGGHHDLVAAAREPRRQRALGGPVAVDVGGVEEVVARRHVGVEQARRILGRRAPAHQHRSEAQAADAQRPEVDAFHGRALCPATAPANRARAVGCAAMALLSELDLPVLDYADPALRGPAFHPRMAELRAQGWLAATPIGAMVLDREAAEVFLRSRSTTFPGLQARRALRHRDRPAGRGAAPQHPLHRRRRPPAPAQPRQPGLHAARRRPLAAAMRTYLEQLWDAVRRRRALRVRRGLRQALPVARHRDGDGRAADRRAAPAPLVQLDPEAVRRRGAHDRARADRGGGRRVLRLRRRAAGRPPSTSPARTSSRPCWPPRPTATACRTSSASTSSSTSSSAASTPRSPSSRTPSACSPSTPTSGTRSHADPSLAAGAVEEALRYEPITPFTARIVVEDMEVRGVAFPAGTVVLVAALHGQPRRRSRTPDRFDITRTDGGRLTTFGAGHPLLPGREPRARRAAGGPRLPGRAHRAPRARRRAGLRRRDRHLRARPPADPLQRRLNRPAPPRSCRHPA